MTDVTASPKPSARAASGPADPPLLDGAARRFPAPAGLDLKALVRDLEGSLAQYASATGDDPFSNPVLRLALELSRRIERGELTHGAIEQLIQHLTVEGFAYRAERLARRLGEVDPDANAERLRARFRAIAHGEGDTPGASFDAFRRRVEGELFGIVVTAHPTFNLTGELMEALATLGTGRDADGRPLDEASRRALLALAAQREHRPDRDLSLAREHALSLDAIANVHAALRRLYAIVLEVAREAYPERWTELTPRLVTVASWVGYDLDGRSDIRWTDTLHKRLRVQERQLRRYLAEVQAVRDGAARGSDLAETLDLIESRLALAIREVSDEIAVFGGHDPAAPESVPHIRRIARRMHEGLGLRLTDAAQAIERLDRAIGLAGDDALRQRLCVLRAEFANHGLGMAHTHVRINSTQLHNAIRKSVGMETAPDDPRYRQSYLAAINELLDRVRPVTINFGSIMAERTSAKRLFMIVAQMLKYADGSTPVRFLIAECESAFTVLAALYYAKLFGVEDRLDVCPLFETERALEAGSRIVDQLLENPHYRAYVERRGRLCIQTGYSDAGRYLGQTPASASIERLRFRILRLFPKHGLKDVQLVLFDTHGESIGRGGHPAGFEDRLGYVSTPASLAFVAEHAIAFKQETSFQGGDGYLHFVTPTAAFAVVARIVEHMLAAHAPAHEDPFYEEADYVTEFFTTVKEFQVRLMRDPNYGALLGAFGHNLLYPSGSRAMKRQHEGTADGIDYQSASQFRAIPQNAILQQLGLPANTIGGVGEAIDKDPERFRSLYARSPRFRQLLGMVEYGAAVASPLALKAYVDTLDPGLWLLRAAGEDPQRAEEMRRVADRLEDVNAHVRQASVFRRLFRDFCILDADLTHGGREGCGALVPPEARTALLLLHAIRIALIHEIFRLAVHVPEFSSQHNTTHRRIVQQLLHLDVPATVEQLKQIFPETADPMLDQDFGEPATYVSDAGQNYGPENERIFRPMLDLHELVRRVGTAITHRIGFFG